MLHECVGEVIHRNWRFNLTAQIAQLVRAYPSLKDSLSVGAGSNPVLGVIFPIPFHCYISSVLFSFAPYLVQGSLPVLLILELCLCIVKLFSSVLKNVICVVDKKTLLFRISTISQRKPISIDIHVNLRLISCLFVSV